MEVWPHVSTSLAASRANEARLLIGQPELVWAIEPIKGQGWVNQP
jgi:hypothetical protein